MRGIVQLYFKEQIVREKRFSNQKQYDNNINAWKKIYGQGYSKTVLKIIEQATPPSVKTRVKIIKKVRDVESIINDIANLKEMDKSNNLGDNVLFLTRKECAILLRVSEKSVDNYIEKGIIKSVRIGRRILINKDDLIKSLQDITPKSE